MHTKLTCATLAIKNKNINKFILHKTSHAFKYLFCYNTLYIMETHGSFSCVSRPDLSAWGTAICDLTRRVAGAVGDFFTNIPGCCLRGAQWTYSRVIKPIGQFTMNWVARPVEQACIYAWNHKGPIAANLVIFALILIFCGSMYGYSQVAKPLVIGLAPAFVLGCTLTGLFLVTFDSDPNVTPSWKAKLLEWDKSVPEWTKTVLVALISTAFLYLCVQQPYVAGALLGASWGAFFVYKKTHDHVAKRDPTLIVVEELPYVPDTKELEERILKLESRLEQRLEQLELPSNPRESNNEPGPSTPHSSP